MAQNTHNYAMVCIFVINNKIKSNPYLPPNPHIRKMAPSRQFLTKMLKHESPIVSETTKPIDLKI